MENSERLGRQARLGFEPGTIRLLVLSVTAVPNNKKEKSMFYSEVASKVPFYFVQYYTSSHDEKTASLYK